MMLNDIENKFLFSDYIELYSEINERDKVSIFCSHKFIKNNVDNDIFNIAVFVDLSFDFTSYFNDFEWGFNLYNYGKSTFSQSYFPSNETTTIEFNDGLKQNDFEYLVALRSFNEKYSDQIEINPKLIWYRNLVKCGNDYLEPITDEVIIKIEKTEDIITNILISINYLKDFLCTHKSKCIIAFDHRRYFEIDTNMKDSQNRYKKDNLFIYYTGSNTRRLSEKSYSSIIGKVAIAPFTKCQHPDYLYLVDEPEFEEYIIGKNADGTNKVFICNEEELANYFGKNPRSPHFLTPVYFENRVLDRYTNDSLNYSINDGNITFLSEWLLPFTRNKEDSIIVWLGDLGRIPYDEQKYWKCFNINPKGGMEPKFYKQQIQNEFTDSILPERKLFSLIDSLNKYFLIQYEKPLFIELSDGDKEIYSSFILPTKNDISDYKKYLLNLCKITVESINLSLIKHIVSKEKLLTDEKKYFGSITQLKILLNELLSVSSTRLVDILKLIYASRNKLTGHRASIKQYNKVWNREAQYKPNYQIDAKNLIFKLIEELDELIEKLGNDNE